MISFQQATQPASRRPASPTLIESMAERMLELGMNGTAVTADSLFEHSDFTRAEIEAHGAAAADLARVRAVRKVA